MSDAAGLPDVVDVARIPTLILRAIADAPEDVLDRIVPGLRLTNSRCSSHHVGGITKPRRHSMGGRSVATHMAPVFNLSK